MILLYNQQIWITSKCNIWKFMFQISPECASPPQDAQLWSLARPGNSPPSVVNPHVWSLRERTVTSWNWLRTVVHCPSPTLSANCPKRPTRRLHSPTAAPFSIAKLAWLWNTPRSPPCHPRRKRRMPRLKKTQYFDNNPGELQPQEISSFIWSDVQTTISRI